jgi:hypothetical protein
MNFFHIFWIINIFIWIKSFTLNVIKSIIHEFAFFTHNNFLKWMYKNLESLTFIFEWVNDN